MSSDPARTICYEGLLQLVKRDEKTRFLDPVALRLRGMEGQKLKAASSSTPRVPMMQAANLREPNDVTLGRRFHTPRYW